MARGEYAGVGAPGQWVWNEELHQGASDLQLSTLPCTTGITTPTRKWSYHDAYCGIGGLAEGMRLSGGECRGAFDQDAGARRVYTERLGVVPEAAWGTFQCDDWREADVLISAPPCEDHAHLIGRNQERQVWQHLDLVRKHKYKVVVMELLLHFKRMHSGLVFRALVRELNELGYDVRCRMLFAPQFGAVAARRRLYLFCTRVDGTLRHTDLPFPAGSDERHPVRSILEPEYFRSQSNVRIRRKEVVMLEHPKQRTRDCITQVGELAGVGPGRDVYSIHGLASSQLATGRGPGWVSGVYLIDGTPSRLTILEGARALQISDHVDLGDVNATAARYIGNTTAVGLARAIGVQVEAALAADPSSRKAAEPAVKNSRPWRLSPENQPLSLALHAAQLMAWAASDAAAKVITCMMASEHDCVWGLSRSDLSKARKGIEAFHRRRWLVLQRRRGEAEILKMIAQGADEATVRRARMTVRKAMWLERMRAGEEESPINLLWWNWPAPVDKELLNGYKLPFRRPPQPTFPDNYLSANVPKVWNEFERMMERRYMEGPYPEGAVEVFMTHPMAAVPKKHSEKLRIIVDCTASLLNDCLVAQRFVLPMVQDAARKCYRGCWMMTADLQDGFYGVEVTGEDRKYLGLRHPLTGLYYRYTRLAMGMACSPSAFSRLVSWAVKVASAYPEFKAERMVVNDTNPNMPRLYAVNAEGRPVPTSDWFVDDGLIVGPTRESCLAAYERLVWVLESRLGWRICRRKSVGPTHKLEFCGLILDSIGDDVGGPCTRLSVERRARCKQIVGDFLAKVTWRRRASRREMAQIVGELSFASNAIPPGRCFLVRLYDAIHETHAVPTGASVDYDREVPVTVAALLDLRWWQQCLDESDCIVLWRTQSFALHRCWSDASNYGFAESVAVKETEEYPQMAFTHGVWPEAVASFSSNWHELATITHSIVSRGAQMRNSQIHYMTDNSTSVSAINTGTVRSPQLMTLSRELKRAQAQHNIGIEAIHLSGQLMQVQGTDGASRAMPYLGMYSGMEGSHDAFDPMEWPVFVLTGDLRELSQGRLEACDQVASDPRSWVGMSFEGQDTYMHLRPAHAAQALELLLDAQLRECDGTSFTVIVPMIGLRHWRKFLKHFRCKKVLPVEVPGLGTVKHWYLRYEAGDGKLPRKHSEEEEGEHDTCTPLPEEEGCEAGDWKRLEGQTCRM